jgi:hypothetical protein
MFRKGLPIGTIVVILIIALAAIGVGYGLWSKVLFIGGTVETGNVDADFDAANTTDTGTTIDPGSDKHVGSCEVTGVGTDELTITILNGYPGYSCDVFFYVTNTGSIPVKVQAYNLTGVPAELVVTTTGLPIGTQLEPNEELLGDLHIRVLQEAEELASYSFSAAITLVQWNEYRPEGAMALCQKDANWACVPGATGVLYYGLSAPTFVYDFNAEGLTPGTSYTLIYYPDPWPGVGLIVLGSGVADADDDLHLVGSPNIGDLTNAKIWLVLTADVGAGQMTGWNPAAYLFEETLITYDDTGP